MICPECRKEYQETLERCPADGASLCEPEDLARLGQRVGNYELMQILGLGGMGVVYGAIHLLLDKPVAIKILCSQYTRRRSNPEDILREARTASRIRHRHIVDVTDFGLTDDGDPYFVMERLEGESLAKLLGRVGRLSPVRAVRIVRQIASALAAAHGLGIIHRDLKPENVYLLPAEPVEATAGNDDPREERDFVKVADFGLAKVIDMEPSSRTKEGIIAGTPVYMSPEHARCEVVDGRSDIYSLGVVLYQMVTGVLPFQGRSALDYLMAHVSKPVPPPQQRCSDVDDELGGIILRMLEKDPARRFATMEELRQELRLYLIGLGRETSTPIAGEPSARPVSPLVASELPTLDNDMLVLRESLAGAGPPSAPPAPPTEEVRTIPTLPDLPSDQAGGHAEYHDEDRTLPPDEPAFDDDDATQPPELPMATMPVVKALGTSRALIAGLAVLLVLTVGLALLLRRDPRLRAAPKPPAPQVRVSLEGLPPHALTYLDGVLRAERPLVLVRGDTDHQLRIEAEGFLSLEQTVSARSDRRIKLQLQPRSAGPAAPRPVLSAASPKPKPALRPRHRTRAATKKGSRVEPATGKGQTTVAPRPKKSGKIDPDDVIDPD